MQAFLSLFYERKATANVRFTFYLLLAVTK